MEHCGKTSPAQRTQLFLEGLCSDGKLVCSLSTSVTLFMLNYCQSEDFEIVFTHRKIPQDTLESLEDHTHCLELEQRDLSPFKFSFQDWSEIPDPVRNVNLPSVCQPSMSLVRCGLCVVLRHIIKASHQSKPHLHLDHLLGFRAGSMKMCSEVSGWTKLCEVELPSSISKLIMDLKKTSQRSSDDKTVEKKIPVDMIRLEKHFTEKCLMHNDNKQRRKDISDLKSLLAHLNSDLETSSTATAGDGKTEVLQSINNCSKELANLSVSDGQVTEDSNIEVLKVEINESHFEIQADVKRPHGVRRFCVRKKFQNNTTKIDSEGLNVLLESEKISKENKINTVNLDTCTENSLCYANLQIESFAELSKEKLARIDAILESTTNFDLAYDHVYSEGAEMTMADLILLVYLRHLVAFTQWRCGNLFSELPCVKQWAAHMNSLGTVQAASLSMGWSGDAWDTALNGGSGSGCEVDAAFSWVVEVLVRDKEAEEEEMELSRFGKMKYKALKPEVKRVLEKLKLNEVRPVTGKHPKGTDVCVDWEALPDGVHPREGGVPTKRAQRKCQQLENLVTAVQAVAKPGDIIVDFCSGGGHLGIVAAHLLPECKVYLVENKEESLMKACSRLEDLKLTNVSLYQCNLDYFIGQFQLGVCLHACGSATDMVLQICLQTRASFVLCPCCYGGIQNTHLLSYPRSNTFLQTSLTYMDFVTLGHAADQTQFDIALEEQGRHCMKLVDTDRLEYAQQWGYDVSLCSLQPLSCTPKNNLLIGTPNAKCLS